MNQKQLRGSGGGKSGGGRSAHEATDTLTSRSYARLLDIVSEGPIEGFADPAHPLKCVLLNGTAVENSDAEDVFTDGNTTLNSATFTTTGSHFTEAMEGRGITGDFIPLYTVIKTFVSSTNVTLSKKATGTKPTATWGMNGTLNFHNFDFFFQNGTISQSYLAGFEASEDTFAVGAQVKHGTDPYQSGWTHTVNDPSIDSIRVDLRIPALQFQDKKTGDIKGTKVQILIQLQSNGGGFVTVIDDTINGKASSPYVRTYSVDLASTTAPWDVRVVRVTEESTTQALVNDTYVDSYTYVVAGKLTHPLSAVVGVTIDAEQFSSIPQRAYWIKGLIVRVPYNYDPITRVYATTGTGTTNGVWNGLFKQAWTDNPAWCWYDLATNKRYGLGDYINTSDVDAFALYNIARYCDQLVPDGRGGTEPRFTCNLYLQAGEDAMKVLSDMASIFRGMIYYADGAIIAAQDSPATSQFLFTPDNVINGMFNYSGTASRARHNVALVKWNDWTDAGREKTEYVEDQDALNESGIVRQLPMTAFGCYSQGQAHRLGAWALESEKILTDTVTFQTGLEGAGVRPSGIISIQDPFRAGEVLSGRITAAAIAGSLTNITLDKTVTLLSGQTYSVNIVDPNTGFVVTKTVTSGAGDRTVISYLTGTTPLPTVGSVFQLAYPLAQLQLYRVLVITQKDEATLEITALEYNASIYEFVDLARPIEIPPISTLPDPNKIAPPGAITVRKLAVVIAGKTRVDLAVGWAKSTDKFLKGYVLSYRFNAGSWRPLSLSPATARTIVDAKPGIYDLAVVAQNQAGISSTPSVSRYIIDSSNPLPTFRVTGLELVGQGSNTIFQQRDAKFQWRLNSPAIGGNVNEITGGINDPSFQSFKVEIYFGATLIWGPLFPVKPSYTFTEEDNAEGMKAKLGLGPTPTFRIEVRALTTWNQLTPAATLTVTNPPPSAPVNFTATSAFKTAFLSWQNAGDVDLNKVEIRRGTTNVFASAVVIAEMAAVRNTKQVWSDSNLTTGTQYYYFLRSSDTFGNYSAATAGLGITPGQVGATDIASFAVDATKQFTSTAVLWNDIWQSNNDGVGAAPGYISWNAHTIYWRGVAYPIAAGNTNLRFIYWQGDPNHDGVYTDAQTSYQTSNTNRGGIAAWNNNSDFQIAINNGGAYELAWYGMANAVIGSANIVDAAITNAQIALLAVDTANIKDAAITNAKVVTLDATKITSGTIDAARIAAGSITAGKITTNTITATQIAAGTITAAEIAAGTITAAEIAAGAITTSKLSVISSSLVANPSFEDALYANGTPEGWNLTGGAVIDSTISDDGARSLKTTAVQYSGAFCKVFPVSGGQTYSIGVGVRVASTVTNIEIIMQSLAGDGTTVLDSYFPHLGAASSRGVLTANTWYRLTGQHALPAAAAFMRIFLRTSTSNFGIVWFDNLFCDLAVNDDGITDISGNKITTGSITSAAPNAYQAGLRGWNINLLGDAEFTNITVRDQIRTFSLVAPTFKNDFDGLAISTSFTYDEFIALSVRPNCIIGRRIRYSIVGEVTTSSPFWNNFANNAPGTGPTDFTGIVQSNGTVAGVYKKTTVWRARECTDPAGNNTWTRLGPEALLTTTYVPATNAVPVLEPPYIYRNTSPADAGTKGSAGYVIRADHTDASAALKQSGDGATYAAYTRGTAITLAAGSNQYFKATRAGYKDSSVAFFSNTASGLPNTTGGGSTGGTAKSQP